jgi:hypothetical protein
MDQIEAALAAAESSLGDDAGVDETAETADSPEGGGGAVQSGLVSPPAPVLSPATAPGSTPTPSGPEPTEEEPKPEEKPQNLPSAALKAAMQRDAAVRKREEAVKAQEERLARLERYEAAQKRWMETGDPNGLFEAHGTSWEAVARSKLGAKAGETQEQPKQPPQRDTETLSALEKAEARIKALEENNAKKDEAIERANLRHLLQQQGDKYDLVNTLERHDRVYELLRDRVRNGGFPEGTTLQDAIHLVANQEQERLKVERLKPMLTTPTGKSMMAELMKVATPGPRANSGESVPKTTTNSQAGDLPLPNGAKGPMKLDDVLKSAEQYL